MKCNFCGREVDNAVMECPYCHYQFKREAQVLNPNDRDSFEGVTIEEDGSTNDGGSKTRYQYQTKDEYMETRGCSLSPFQCRWWRLEAESLARAVVHWLRRSEISY